MLRELTQFLKVSAISLTHSMCNPPRSWNQNFSTDADLLAVTKMDTTNLALVFASNIIRPEKVLPTASVSVDTEPAQEDAMSAGVHIAALQTGM